MTIYAAGCGGDAFIADGPAADASEKYVYGAFDGGIFSGGAVVSPPPAIAATGDTVPATGLTATGGYDGLIIEEETISYDYTRRIGIAGYTVQNESAEPICAQLAFPYNGGLYWPSGNRVFCGGEEVRFDLAFDWTDAPDESRGIEHFDENAGYFLYTVKVSRTPQDAGQIANAYIGADFTLDVSKTRIVADGFGYAANAYGAVRIWSLSDGFDTGMERHLFIIGNDIDLAMGVYEDSDLSIKSDTLDIEIERRELSARDYLLTYSGPLAVYNRAEKPNDATPVNAVPDAGNGTPAVPAAADAAQDETRAYTQALYRAYARALDELLEIHYFVPRGELYAKAEARRINAMLFNVEIPAGDKRSVTVMFQ